MVDDVVSELASMALKLASDLYEHCIYRYFSTVAFISSFAQFSPRLFKHLFQWPAIVPMVMRPTTISGHGLTQRTQ